jgi:RNA polymerase sigma-70 factor (ECF subfamily)
LAFFGSRSHSSLGETPAELRIRALMAAHFDFIWRILRRMGLSAVDADDGAQEVFVIASRKLSVITAPSEKRFLFATALRVAATRRCGLKRRREQPRAWLAEEESLPPRESSELGAGRLAELAHARRDLNEILAAMKLEQRAVFLLYELEEMTVPEIASLLDVPIGTVSSRLRVAREEFDLSLRRLRARAQSSGVKA